MVAEVEGEGSCSGVSHSSFSEDGSSVNCNDDNKNILPVMWDYYLLSTWTQAVCQALDRKPFVNLSPLTL